jgi:hypothetical protein
VRGNCGSTLSPHGVSEINRRGAMAALLDTHAPRASDESARSALVQFILPRAIPDPKGAGAECGEYALGVGMTPRLPSVCSHGSWRQLCTKVSLLAAWLP